MYLILRCHSNKNAHNSSLQGATDVGALSQAVNLRSLSLAFNSLASLAGLAPLSCLQSLNVSHNQIASLKVPRSAAVVTAH